MNGEAAAMSAHAAAEYLARGWSPIPIPWREKNPGFDGWQHLRVTPETLGEHFNGVRQNIGVLLGEPSGGLTDTDLDSPEALITADYFLPDTGSVFGRASTPSSHRLFVANCPTRKFTDPMARGAAKAMLVELRSTGSQTVFPGSTHKETGEAIEWVCDNGPAEVDGAELTRLAGRIAASALIARYWPIHARHDASLALSGALRHSGWALEQTEIFVKAVVEAACDEEATDRIRAARDTYAKGTPTTGWPRFAEVLGEPIIGRLRDWLGVGKDATAEDWSEPGHISQELLPVPAFDPDVLLPEPLRGWIVDQAEGMPCPIEFIAVPALVMAGSVIGARCGLRPKVHSHWVSIANLWGGIVGAPGSMKSPAIHAAARPLGRVIKAAKMDHAEAMKAYKARQKALAAAGKDDFLEDEEAPPIEKRFKTNDATIEKLADLLIENPAGLLVQRDELVGLIASWDMKGREQDRALYLEAWNGNEDKDVDRIKRGSSYLPNLCLSVFGGIQPVRLAAYLNQAQDALADDGMLQRFQMLVYPDPVRWENVDRKPNTASLERAYGVFKALAEMVPERWGADSNQFIKFPYFAFEDAAQEAFNEWHTELHRSRLPAEENPLIAQYLAKLDNLFLGLALIFHLIEIADRQIPSWSAWVSLAAVQRAKAWCIHLEAHARRCYGMMVSNTLRSAQVLAAKVRGGKLEDGFTFRDVLRKSWRGLTDASDIEAALRWLEEEGWLRSRSIGGTGPGSGRRTTKYEINPRVVLARTDNRRVW